VGEQGETDQNPWETYHAFKEPGATDRFGRHHSDDAESVGPHAALAVVRGLPSLLTGAAQPAHDVVAGLFIDAGGNLADSPFPGSSPGFGGAVDVVVVSGSGVTTTYRLGHGVRSFATRQGSLQGLQERASQLPRRGQDGIAGLRDW
jgi:hypothetical protein